MMMSSTPPPPPANNNDLAFITALLAVLSDAKETEKQLTAMLEARQAWTAARDEANAEKRKSDAAVAENRAVIAKEQAEHSASLRDAQAAFDRKREQQEADIQSRDHQSRALAAQAATDAATAAKLKADLEARFAILRQAGV